MTYKRSDSDLFDLDNIKDSVSTLKLKDMGGAAGLLGLLKTNVEVKNKFFLIKNIKQNIIYLIREAFQIQI